MNIKKRFNKSKKYFLKHINSETYKQEKLSYEASRKKDLEEFLKNKPELNNRTDAYDTYSVTHITICDVLSNDGVTKILQKLYLLSSKKYKKDIYYKKPTIFKKYDYVQLLYSHSFHGRFAEIKFIDDKYIDSINISWAQINSFYALLV